METDTMPNPDDYLRPDVREAANTFASVIDSMLPAGKGFALLIFDFGENGHMNWISNAEREDMIKAMKEFVARHEH